MVALQQRLSSLGDVGSAPDGRAPGEQNTQREPCQKMYRLHNYLLFHISFIACDLNPVEDWR